MARHETHATERQREEFGGINWGAAFFGWLVAVGIGVLLTALLSAAGTAIALSEIEGDASGGESETIGIVGGALLLLVMAIAYFSGGYVAGRMSRFDGARQGLAVFAWSIIAAIVLAIVGAIAGSEYNLFSQLDLPRIPIDEGDLTTGGVIFLVAAIAVIVLAAMAGGKAGERYHHRVDAVGDEAVDRRRETVVADHDHDRDHDQTVREDERELREEERERDAGVSPRRPPPR